jgi:hypothetical protein
VSILKAFLGAIAPKNAFNMLPFLPLLGGRGRGMEGYPPPNLSGEGFFQKPREAK